MPSGPNLFDDEVGAAPDPHSQRSGIDDAPSETAAAPRRRRPPNYLIRRAVVVGGVVAVLATASIVVGQLTGSGTNDTGSGAISTEWNRIVLVDDRTGRIIVNNAEGEELSRIESGIRSPNASAIVDSTLVAAGTEQINVIDIDSDSETIDEYDFGADAIVGPAGSALTMIAPRPDGGRALLVHGPSGDLIDTDTFAPVVGARYEFSDARSSTSGRNILVTDSGNFQSVLFSLDRDEPSFFPGLALAVDNELVVTAQNVGNDATISLFDHAGAPVATGRTPSVRAGMIGSSGVVLVTVDGAIVIMSSSNGDVADESQLDIGTIESGGVATSGDRLVVAGTSGTAIIDDMGGIIATLDDQRPVENTRAPAGSACMVTSTTIDDTESQVAVVDLTNGTVRVEATGAEPVLTDASGCIAGTPTSGGFDILGADGVQQFQTGDTLLALSLDGLSAATERSGRVVLIDPGDPDAESVVDLGPRGRTVHFTQS